MARIVLCEDEQLILRLIKRALSDHEVYVARDGIEGLAVIERERPDLVLTDIFMPRYDGFQLAQALRADPRFVDLPLIFITGFARKYDQNEANRYNPICFLVKPFGEMDLKIIIEAALKVSAR